MRPSEYYKPAVRLSEYYKRKMSEDLSQNHTYTIFSSGNDTVTLIWPEYVSATGIRPWYFIQDPWYFNGHKAIERYWDAEIGRLTGPKFE